MDVVWLFLGLASWNVQAYFRYLGMRGEQTGSAGEQPGTVTASDLHTDRKLSGFLFFFQDLLISTFVRTLVVLDATYLPELK